MFADLLEEADEHERRSLLMGFHRWDDKYLSEDSSVWGDTT
jgi:hypothetical protein